MVGMPSIHIKLLENQLHSGSSLSVHTILSKIGTKMITKHITQIQRKVGAKQY